MDIRGDLLLSGPVQCLFLDRCLFLPVRVPSELNGKPGGNAEGIQCSSSLYRDFGPPSCLLEWEADQTQLTLLAQSLAGELQLVIKLLLLFSSEKEILKFNPYSCYWDI